MFAVVDIETTGGSAQIHRITEVAIYLFDGENVVDEFITLINPETYIPPYITQLTGITNEMVANAPRFYEVARRIVEITEGAFFVAHNAQFDYRFIQAEFKRLGYSYSRDTLCTVKLSRKHLPGYQSYSLGNICQQLGISINGRHRAAGDALATVKLFERILSVTPRNELNKGNKIENLIELAPNIDYQLVKNLPETTGVYFFHNQKGDIIYIGKSVNIRKRVTEHLAHPDTKRATEMASQVADIDYVLTGSELIALIAEADAIKEHLPKFNKKGRRKTSQLGLYSFYDSNGYCNLRIESVSKQQKEPITCFENISQGRETLYKLIEKHNLCQKLCGLYETSGSCFHHQIGLCKGACNGYESSESYNIRVSDAIHEFGLKFQNFLLIDEGRSVEEKSFVKILNGKLQGYGYFHPEYISSASELLNEPFTPCGNHRDAIQVVRSFMGKKGAKVIRIE